MVKLSSNPTCVLSDADVITNEQAERIAKVLTKHLPGADNVTEAGKILGVDANGDVALVEDKTGSTYTAGEGLTLENGEFSVDNPMPGASGASQGDVLTVGANGPEWTAPSGGGVTKQVISLTGATVSQDATSTTFTFNLASANQFYALGKLVSVNYKSHYIPSDDTAGTKIKLSWGSNVSQIITLDANVYGAANIFCASVFVGNETDISQASDPTLGFKFTKVEIVAPALNWMDSTEADSLQIQMLG